MTKRILCVIVWLYETPPIAVCSIWGAQFEVPTWSLTKTTDACAYLQERFTQRECKSGSTRLAA